MNETDSIILSLVIDILGSPKNPYNMEERSQFEFNCPSVICRNDEKFNLAYNSNLKFFKCWKCGSTHGTKGFVDKLVKKYGSREHVERLNLILPNYKSDYINVFRKPEANYNLLTCNIPRFFSPLNQKKNTKSYNDAYDYAVNKRKISVEQIDKFNIGYAEYGECKNRVIFPSYNQLGKINFFEARTYIEGMKPPYINPKEPDKEFIIFNEKFINWDLPIYLVEGVFDAIRIPNAIPILGKKIPFLIIEKILQHGCKVVLCLDDDAINDEIEIYEILMSLGIDVYIVNMDGKKDVSKVYESGGQVAITNLLLTKTKFDIIQRLELLKK